MNIFGVGPMELLIVVALAFLLLGPARMGSTARKLGGFVKEARKVTEGLPKTLDDLARAAEAPEKSGPKALAKGRDSPDEGPAPWRPSGSESEEKASAPPSPRKADDA
jgi:Sec-independent protein translocase protein TatA